MKLRKRDNKGNFTTSPSGKCPEYGPDAPRRNPPRKARINPDSPGIVDRIGEKRVTKYTGIAVSLAPEVDTSDGAAWRPKPTGDAKADAKLAAEAMTQHLFEQVCAEYDPNLIVKSILTSSRYCPSSRLSCSSGIPTAWVV